MIRTTILLAGILCTLSKLGKTLRLSYSSLHEIRILSSPSEPQPNSDKLAVFTFETDPKNAVGYQYLQQSALRHSVQLINLAQEGEEWKGWSYRLTKLREKVLSSGSDYQYACFVDGRDALILRDSDSIVRALQELPSPQQITVALNRNVRPEVEATLQEKFGLCKGVRLNAGSWCGSATAVLHYLDLATSLYKIDQPQNYEMDDQVMMTDICRDHEPELFHIDLAQKLIFCEANSTKPSAPEDEEGVIGGEISHPQRLVETGAGIAHIPGNTDLDNLYEYFGYA